MQEDAASTESSGPRSTSRLPRSEIAWAGWRMPVGEDWRPFKIEGGQARGSMMIGNGEQPIVRVQWSRAKEGNRFDAPAWIERRLKKIGAVPGANAPCPASLDRAAWVRDLATKGGTTRTIWYGYSAAARLMLELIVTSLTAEALRRDVFKSLVPRLKVSPPEAPSYWSVYGVGFACPVGFKLKQRHLYSGDIALRFEREKTSLLLRQVYPAGLAVSRRSASRWLRVGPFKERRRMRKAQNGPWRHASRKLEGVTQQGWKRLPPPLGFAAPRYSTAVAATDTALDRLLIAELQTRRPGDAATVAWAIERMNRG